MKARYDQKRKITKVKHNSSLNDMEWTDVLSRGHDSIDIKKFVKER